MTITLENSQKIKIGFYLTVTVWIAWLMTGALDWEWEAKLLPLLAGGLGIILSVTQLVRLTLLGQTLEGQSEGVTSNITDDETTEASGWSELQMIAWLFVFLVLAAAFGMFYALPLFLGGFLYFFTRNWKHSLILTIVFSIMMYLFFVEILGIRLWRGLFNLEPII